MAAANLAGPRASVMIAPLTAALVRIKGTFSGKYTSTLSGKSFAISIRITKYSHSGHFSGFITATSSKGTSTGTVSGSIRSNMHFTITFSIAGSTGTLTGKSTRTGGRLKGSYTTTFNGSDYGTFNIGKA